jgi:DNA-binding GntR family transcriptional regulator
MNGVYKAMVQRLVKSYYPGGRRLTENEISEEFHISRTPVREILRQLERDGLVEFTPRKGARVIPFNTDDVEEIYEIRKSLEQLALKYSAPSLSIHSLKEIRDLVVRSSRSTDYREHTRTDRVFHRFILTTGSRRQIIRILEQQLHLIEFFRDEGFTKQEERDCVTEEHLNIIDILCTRDTERAARALVDHIENAKLRVISNLVRGKSQVF